jgi:hypothetical protein
MHPAECQRDHLQGHESTMVQIFDLVAERAARLGLTLEPAPQPRSPREREAMSAARLIASNTFQQLTTRDPAEAKRVLTEAAMSIAAIYDQYPLREICYLAISLWTRSTQVQLPRREVRKITNIPFELVETLAGTARSHADNRLK